MTTTHMSYTPKAPSRCTPLRSPEKNLKIFEVNRELAGLLWNISKKKRTGIKNRKTTHITFVLTCTFHPSLQYLRQSKDLNHHTCFSQKWISQITNEHKEEKQKIKSKLSNFHLQQNNNNNKERENNPRYIYKRPRTLLLDLIHLMHPLLLLHPHHPHQSVFLKNHRPWTECSNVL